jgi:hypothetical protein
MWYPAQFFHNRVQIQFEVRSITLIQEGGHQAIVAVKYKELAITLDKLCRLLGLR